MTDGGRGTGFCARNNFPIVRKSIQIRTNIHTYIRTEQQPHATKPKFNIASVKMMNFRRSVTAAANNAQKQHQRLDFLHTVTSHCVF